jgi:hypothetical protein
VPNSVSSAENPAWIFADPTGRPAVEASFQKPSYEGAP